MAYGLSIKILKGIIIFSTLFTVFCGMEEEGDVRRKMSDVRMA
jgi:hypothetical protein